jgi:hypothetical protein
MAKMIIIAKTLLLILSQLFLVYKFLLNKKNYLAFTCLNHYT